jgi:hypothetical protein
VKAGAAVDPVELAKIDPDAAVESEKLKAGVEVAVATLVVKSGDSVPALNDVTVPDPDGVAQLTSAPAPPDLRYCVAVPTAKTCQALLPRKRICPRVDPKAESRVAVIVLKAGAAVEAVALPKTVFAAAVAALVPPLATGNVPVVSAVRLTEAQVAAPLAFNDRGN